MKAKYIIRFARLSVTTFAVALFAGLYSGVKAGEIPTGKGATRLLQVSGTTRLNSSRESRAPAARPAEYRPMSCAKCKDTSATVADLEPKGGGARALISGGTPKKVIWTHGCEGCGTEWVLSGHGKAKTSAGIHKCTSCGAETLACCNTRTGSDVATRGMEK